MFVYFRISPSWVALTLCLGSVPMAALAGDSAVDRLRAGSRLLEHGDFASAIMAFESLLKDAPQLEASDVCRANALYHLGWSYGALDRDREAQGAYREARAILDPKEEFHYPHLIRVLEAEAGLEAKRLHYGPARVLLERAQSIVVKLAPDNRLEASSLSVELGAIDQLDGKRDRAAARYRTALEVIEAVLGRQSMEWRRAANNLATLLLLCGKRAEAAFYIDEVLRQRESMAGLDRVALGKFLLTRFDVYFALGRKQEEERDIVEALEIFQSELGPSNRLTAEALRRYGALCRALGRKTEAREYARRAQDSLDNSPSVQLERNTISANELLRPPGH
jgi:tetratricopeptide (TPR) repeat protein